MHPVLLQLLEQLTLELGTVVAEKIVSNLAPMVADMVTNNPELVLAGVLLCIAYCMYKHEQQKNLLR